MEKYRRVVKKETGEKPKGPENEIRVTAKGRTATYISYASKLFNEKEMDGFTIKATGTALATAVTVSEILKRRFKGLHQVTKLGSVEIIDEFEPLEEGLEPVTGTRNVSFIEIHLSKSALDTSDRGYQAPIDESLVKEMDAEEIARPRTTGRKKGAGKRKGKKGSGKGKKSEDSSDTEDKETTDETPKKKGGRRRKPSKAKAEKSTAGEDEEETADGVEKKKKTRAPRKKAVKTSGEDSKEGEDAAKSTEKKGKKGKGKGKSSKGKGKGKSGKGKGKKGKGKGKASGEKKEKEDN